MAEAAAPLDSLHEEEELSGPGKKMNDAALAMAKKAQEVWPALPATEDESAAQLKADLGTREHALATQMLDSIAVGSVRAKSGLGQWVHRQLSASEKQEYKSKSDTEKAAFRLDYAKKETKQQEFQTNQTF